MQLAYRSYGSGTPIIILHGLFGQSDNWNTLAKQLATHSFKIFTIDQRNHGLSPHSNEWSYELMAQDLKEFIETHKLEQPIILGHSMGGKTALFFEAIYPGIAQKLIIADIAPRAYQPQHNQVLEGLNAVNFSTITTRKQAEEALGMHISDFGTKQFLLKNIYWKDTESNAMDWRFNLQTITKNYENVSVEVPFFKSTTPTLVIAGQKSDYISVNDIIDFENRFSNIRFATIANAGHWVHAEKPQDFFNEVINFITT